MKDLESGCNGIRQKNLLNEYLCNLQVPGPIGQAWNEVRIRQRGRPPLPNNRSGHRGAEVNRLLALAIALALQ